MKRAFRPLSYWLPPIAWAAGIFGLSCLSLPPKPPLFPMQDKLAHMILYALLALLLLRAFTGERKWGLRKAALLAFLLTSLYGVTDEFHQYFTPTRSVDILDWVADSVGAAAVFVSLLWPRRKASRSG